MVCEQNILQANKNPKKQKHNQQQTRWGKNVPFQSATVSFR